MGLFGTTAPVLIDVNLILQYVSLLLLIIGYIKRKPLKNHGYIMMSVLLITIGTTLAIMAPRLLFTVETVGPTIIGHAAIGILAMLIGTLFVFRFIKSLRAEEPLMCGTKNWMRLAFLLWIFPIIAGTGLYIMMYV